MNPIFHVFFGGLPLFDIELELDNSKESDSDTPGIFKVIPKNAKYQKIIDLVMDVFMEGRTVRNLPMGGKLSYDDLQSNLDRIKQSKILGANFDWKGENPPPSHNYKKDPPYIIF